MKGICLSRFWFLWRFCLNAEGRKISIFRSARARSIALKKKKKKYRVFICEVNTKAFWIKYCTSLLPNIVVFSWREIWFSTYHQKHFDNNWLANWCSIQWVWENDKNTSKHPFSHIPFFRFSAHSGETVKTKGQ